VCVYVCMCVCMCTLVISTRVSRVCAARVVGLNRLR
jgi:hypothetical protein